MFGIKKKIFHLSISVDDNFITCVAMGHNQNGYYTVFHKKYLLEYEVIKMGEILSANKVSGIFKEIYLEVKNAIPKRSKISTSILLNNELFSFYKLHAKSEKDISFVIDNFLESLESNKDVADKKSYSYRYNSDQKELYIELLPSHQSDSYILLLKNTGLLDARVHSNTSAIPFFMNKEKDRVLLIENSQSQILTIEQNQITDISNTDFSYSNLCQVVVKYLGVNNIKASDIIANYGISRAHPDEKIYHQLAIIFKKLTNNFKSLKMNKDENLYLWYVGTPLVGLKDSLFKELNVNIFEFDILNNPDFPTHEVQSIHKREGSQYSLVIADCMVSLSNY